MDVFYNKFPLTKFWGSIDGLFGIAQEVISILLYAREALEKEPTYVV